MFTGNRPTVYVNNYNQINWHEDTLSAMVKTQRFWLYNSRVFLVEPASSSEELVKLIPLVTRVALRSWLNRYICFMKKFPADGHIIYKECIAPSSLASGIANANTFKGEMKTIVFENCKYIPDRLYRYTVNSEGNLVLTKFVEEREVA